MARGFRILARRVRILARGDRTLAREVTILARGMVEGFIWKVNARNAKIFSWV